MSDQMLTVLVWRGTADKGRYIEYKVRGLENHTLPGSNIVVSLFLPSRHVRILCDDSKW